MSKIKKTDNCWIWIGTKQKGDYGQFWLNGKKLLAHRVSYELFKDEIQKGFELDHLCRNHTCVNPEHLESVIHKENIRRGFTGKHQLLKTHCPQGHEYSDKRNSEGRRRCLICHRVINKNYRIRKSLKSNM